MSCLVFLNSLTASQQFQLHYTGKGHAHTWGKRFIFTGDGERSSSMGSLLGGKLQQSYHHSQSFSTCHCSEGQYYSAFLQVQEELWMRRPCALLPPLTWGGKVCFKTTSSWKVSIFKVDHNTDIATKSFEHSRDAFRRIILQFAQPLNSVHWNRSKT